MKLTSVLVSTTEEFQLSEIDIHRDVVCGTILSVLCFIYICTSLNFLLVFLNIQIEYMVYIVLKYYCVLITNSHVLSIALYEFRQTLNIALFEN